MNVVFDVALCVRIGVCVCVCMSVAMCVCGVHYGSLTSHNERKGREKEIDSETRGHMIYRQRIRIINGQYD